MENPGFIGVADIQRTYLPMGFENFKIEGRELGSALVLEFLLYYLTKPEYQLKVREEIYLITCWTCSDCNQKQPAEFVHRLF